MWDYDYILNKLLITYGETGVFELIAKYSGDILEVARQEDVIIEVLNDSFAILTLTYGNTKNVLSYDQINFVELPKKLSVVQQADSLVDEFYKEPFVCPPDPVYGLTGKGILVAVLDTGITYQHKDFRNNDGTSRILYIWDQTVEGTPPEGFFQGTVFTKQMIDFALETGRPLGTIDSIGHGTMVSGVCVGNGNQSDGRFKGVAPEASILCVKLGKQEYESFAMTTEFMRAIKFAYDKAKEVNMPLVINVSYGSNNGSHKGLSLFEQYIDSMVSSYPSSFVVATGNEGDAGHHYESTLMNNESESIDFTIAGGLKSVYFSLWQNFVDNLSIEIVTPSNESTNKIFLNNTISRFEFEDCIIKVAFLPPSPYRNEQEIYCQIDFRNFTNSISNWKLNVYSEIVVDGTFQVWLPTIEEVTRGTAFLKPTISTTLTIPSTANSVISVGGYDTKTNNIASFSGRGFTANEQLKPEIVAPGVDILTTDNILGYDVTLGTSFAAPFVSGACAVLMEYGIIKGNEIFLYGEKLKAFLEKGAKRLDDVVYPNRDFGYGFLCIENTINEINFLNTGKQVTINQNNINFETAEILVKKTDNALPEIEKLPYYDSIRVDTTTFDDFFVLEVPKEYYNETLDALSKTLEVEEAYPLSPMGETNFDYENLKGDGVLIGIIDTGINIYEQSLIANNETKINYFLDMNSNTELNSFKINKLLSQEKNIQSISHATNIINTISNIVPNANFICVDLKKKNNKNIFSSIDLIKSINYVIEKSKKFNMPVSIAICLGTNKRNNAKNSMFLDYITSVSQLNGVCICVSAGNEANKKHHDQRILKHEKPEIISLNVSENEKEFPLYFYTKNVEFFILKFKTPNGESFVYAPKVAKETVEYKFKLETTKLIINFDFYKQQIVVEFRNSVGGVFEIEYTASLVDDDILDVYLPVANLIDKYTYFTLSSPSHTITAPATADKVICVGAYDFDEDKISEYSGRGPDKNFNIRPTVLGSSSNKYSTIRGTSIATAEITAICAKILQWGIVNKNLSNMNTTTIENILTSNTIKNDKYTYPNNIEGYGIISSKL